jgi:SAM-dependent methyltransferase
MNEYRKILYADYSASFGGLKEFDHGVGHFPIFDEVLSEFNAAKDAEVLDVGCGKGEWLGWLKQRGHLNLTGIDGSPSDVKVAASWLPGVQVIEADAIDFLASKAANYDVIHAKDLIEHLTKDEIVTFLQRAHASLKPAGQIWLQTFNAQAPFASATRYGDFTHETGLTPPSIAQCLRACGFSDVSIKGVHYCSPSLGGRVRKLLSLPVKQIARLVLKLRHGGSNNTPGLDRFMAEPDMLVIACR